MVAQSPVGVVGVGVDVGDVGQQQKRVVEIRPGVGILPVVCLDAELNGLQRRGDPVLLPFEKVQRDGTRVVGLEQLGLLPLQLGAADGKFGQLSGTFTHHLVEFRVDHPRECAPGLGWDLNADVEAFDEALHVLNEHGLAGAVVASGVAGGADEVRGDGALTRLRVADDEPRAALPTEDAALEVVVMDLGRIGRRLVCAQHDLDLLPDLDWNDRFVGSAVGDVLVHDGSLVVRVGEHPVNGGLRDRFGRAPWGRRRGQPAGDEFLVELAGGPVPRGEDLEGPAHQLGAFLVDLDGADLAAHVVTDADVAVANRCLRDGATLGSLLGQALDDFGGEVAGVELGDRGHDAVQQHARRGLVDVLRGGDQSDACVLQGQVDGDVVGPVAGQAVDLVDDAVVRLVGGDVLDHPHEFGPVGLAGGLARVDELLHDGGAQLIGLALIGLTLSGD